MKIKIAALLVPLLYLGCSRILAADDTKKDPYPAYQDSWDTSEMVRGITLDDPWSNLSAIVDSIASLAHAMTTRIVFDEWIPASEYQHPVDEIKEVSEIQGLILDSFYVKDYSIDQYVTRANEYLNQFENSVDIWEVGNEVNGEWLGNTPDVVAKILGAYQAVKARGKTTAITLYYNGIYANGQPTADNCWENPENQMLVWAEQNIPAEMKNGLDYVWVSFYEDDCLDISPDWQSIFNTLGEMFPGSKLGIGECGTLIQDRKEVYINRYYRDMRIDHPRYVGGYFWWYGKQDFVPKSKELWQVLLEALGPAPPRELRIVR